MTRKTLDRTVLNVAYQDGVWAVELDGERFGHSPDKEIVRATATKHARQVQDDGRPCEIRVAGEFGLMGR